MILMDIAFAEEAPSLPAPERAELVKLLIDSLEGEPRSNEEVQAELQKRFESLRSGEDKGIVFDQVFGESL